MPSINRASVTFAHDAEFQMLVKLAEVSGSSISAMAGRCISDYLRAHYAEMLDFYLQAPDQ